jgi:hypothetical protein
MAKLRANPTLMETSVSAQLNPLVLTISLFFWLIPISV